MKNELVFENNFVELTDEELINVVGGMGAYGWGVTVGRVAGVAADIAEFGIAFGLF
ncbi:MAG: ComC/BlpC family leader-containing pheromone/bacteriocin [Streptococcaceae bacterium]|jgi:hypothetical protein|nr:ComC/BlpC family leader-containing pheromone/bacteriocin [Streptococcaceae bacterium]